MKKMLTAVILLLLLLVMNSHTFGNGAITSVEVQDSSIAGGIDSAGNMYMVSDHLKVIFAGTNPDVSFFYKENGTEFPTFYKIRFSWINETDKDGNIVKYYRLEQSIWNHTDIVSYVDSDNNTILNANFTTIMRIFNGVNFVDVPITIEVYMFEGTRIIELGNNTIEVPTGSFKYSLTVGAWPFESSNNSLLLSVALISNLDAVTYNSINNGEKIISNSSSEIQFSLTNPDIAMIDETETNISTAILQRGSLTNIIYNFPYYSKELYYDPIIDLAKTEQVSEDGNNSDMKIEAGNLSVIFEGTTPHAKFFFRDNTSEFTTFYKIMFMGLNETSPNGELVNYWRLETAIWNHTGPTTISIGNTTAINVNFTTEMTIMAGSPPSTYTIPIKISVYLFLEEGTISYGNTSIAVTKGVFKFSLEMGSWPFASPDNTLGLQVAILSNINARMNFEEQTKRFVSTSDEGVSMFMDNEEIAILDGEISNVSINFMHSSGQNFLTYEFGYFNSSLYYDPTITLSAESGSSSTTETTSDTTTGDTTTSDSNESAGETATTSESSVLPGFTFVYGILGLIGLIVTNVLRKNKLI